MAKVDAYYPPSPRNVPADLTQPTAQYKKRVVLTLVSLLLFFVLYLGLIVGSLAACVLSLLAFPVGIIFLIPSVFFFLFLLKGFFKKQEKEAETIIEVTEEEQPLLFEFIHKVCEDTGAPQPHKIFVDDDVNAYVSYNSTVLALFLPTPKNLTIGLGLVNMLNLSEFKSVMAHEFGHFSQSSMKVGTYVYQANKIIGDLVGGRDWFDRMLESWTRLDVRIAWIGWILYGIVWLLRKVLEGFFYLINMLKLSLSREMEFNADLVAVSVTGSDAGVHGLYRLTFADESWSQAMGDLRSAMDHKLYTSDLYYHVNHATNYLRKLKKDPKLGEPPPLPDDPRDTADLFKPEDSGIPQMWASHPSNYDREQNAKAYYIRSVIDDRSAWVLFKDPQQLREEITYRFYRVHAGLKKRELEDQAGAEEVQKFIDDEHSETTYDARYHGVYDARYLEIEDVEEIIKEAKTAKWNEGRLKRVHLKLYDAELKEWMEGHKAREEEHELLSGLESGELELKGEDLEFRGRKYDVEEAKRLLKKVDKELEEDRQYFEALDRRTFLVYYQMAIYLDDAIKRELRERYEFHVTCQGMLKRLNTERTHLNGALAFLEGKSQLEHDDFRAALRAFRDAHKALSKSLDTADDLPLPRLKNMKVGKPLGWFLLDKRLVHSLGRHEHELKGEWIGKLLSQMDEVIAKLRRIHFKSLGAILLLQDRIQQQWKEQLAAMPMVQAAADPPPRPPRQA